MLSDVQNVLFNWTREAAEITRVHLDDIAFVKQWLSEWKAPGAH
jgi:hypothetical protein